MVGVCAIAGTAPGMTTASKVSAIDFAEFPTTTLVFSLPYSCRRDGHPSDTKISERARQVIALNQATPRRNAAHCRARPWSDLKGSCSEFLGRQWAQYQQSTGS